jgi:hypothetical protein
LPPPELVPFVPQIQRPHADRQAEHAQHPQLVLASGYEHRSMGASPIVTALIVFTLSYLLSETCG